MENTKYLGERIKNLRKNRNFTQEKFAELISVDPKHLSRIECGKTQPSLNLIKKMSLILGVEISKFFEAQTLDTKETLIFKINEILKNSTEEKIKTYYKILNCL